MAQKVLHLVTQDGQGFGSTRKCCENCGLAIFAIEEDNDAFADDRAIYKLVLEKGHEGDTFIPCQV